MSRDPARRDRRDEGGVGGVPAVERLGIGTGAPGTHRASLIVGSSHDVPAIASVIRGLPDTAHGRVFVEAVSPVQIRTLPAHPGLTVTWLLRGVDGGRPALRKGQRLLFAMNAWLAEWLIEGEPAPFVWAGAGDCPLIDPFLAELTRRLDQMR
ncbi:hypothetical protein FM119_03835 [Mycetocola reblochoni REB411]|uniref:SIP-like Rossmann fold domain-containing protein n=1 Tax=Mycetocola reblochoni REB411 TaxID=1255698 RepID=A0A1R4IVT5_9MICO|nr:hypothetical protein FM119_03835 [Mycetocola reblochoni REB411]